eukprot:764219-Hanusia_phi.AAC.4
MYEQASHGVVGARNSVSEDRDVQGGEGTPWQEVGSTDRRRTYFPGKISISREIGHPMQAFTLWHCGNQEKGYLPFKNLNSSVVE